MSISKSPNMPYSINILTLFSFAKNNILLAKKYVSGNTNVKHVNQSDCVMKIIINMANYNKYGDTRRFVVRVRRQHACAHET